MFGHVTSLTVALFSFIVAGIPLFIINFPSIPYAILLNWQTHHSTRICICQEPELHPAGPLEQCRFSKEPQQPTGFLQTGAVWRMAGATTRPPAVGPPWF